jgi:preprotein translocase subunit SecG
MNFFEFFKKLWLLTSLIITVCILIRKADDESLNSFQLPFLSSSKKSEKLFDNFIWILISFYLIIGLSFSTKYFI